jgi:hypothetical protein
MEFPRRYKLKGIVLILIIIGAVLGIWIQRSGIKQVRDQIEISSVSIVRSGNQFIELEYVLANTSNKALNINLMAKVWDVQENELASALFSIDIQPHSSSKRSKMLDKLNRSLKDGERPYKAEISLYERKVP